MNDLHELDWVPRWTALGEPFVRPVPPTALQAPRWVAVNDGVAARLGLKPDWWQHPRALPCMAGNAPGPLGSTWASVYSGHQFGVWAGQLGDGRALSLGEVQVRTGKGEASSPPTCADTAAGKPPAALPTPTPTPTPTPDTPPQAPQNYELQLKGAGRTPYSRFGDGRAVLRSSIREYLCSAAMQGLGIASTQALCLVASDEPVMREQLETAAVVCRVSPSFLRFGHFEHFAAAGDSAALRTLLAHAMQHHSPEQPTDAPAQWLQQVVRSTADLMADWQAVGFCHGVMNTDNMSVLGLTLDYGPFQFMDAFDPQHICNHTDHQGRYAYQQQPRIAHWNLLALAHALHGLIDADALQTALQAYRPRFEASLAARWAHKLGLPPALHTPQAVQQAHALGTAWLSLLARHRADYTRSWRGLAHVTLALAQEAALPPAHALHTLSQDHWPLPLATDPDVQDFLRQHQDWLTTQGQSLPQAAACMLASNPVRVLRKHLAEIAIQQAQAGDYREVQNLQAALQNPFDDAPQWAAYAELPPSWAQELQISCSS